MSLLSELPNDVVWIICRLIHKSYCREVMDEYNKTWRICTSPHQFRLYNDKMYVGINIETFGGAFLLNKYDDNDPYRFVRWGDPRVIYDDWFSKTITRKGQRTNVNIPKRYRYSNGGFFNELIFIQFEE